MKMQCTVEQNDDGALTHAVDTVHSLHANEPGLSAAVLTIASRLPAGYRNKAAGVCSVWEMCIFLSDPEIFLC